MKNYIKKYVENNKGIIIITFVIWSSVNLSSIFLKDSESFYLLVKHPSIGVLVTMVFFYLLYYLLIRFLLVFNKFKRIIIWVSLIPIILSIPILLIGVGLSGYDSLETFRSPMDNHEIVCVESNYIVTKRSYYSKVNPFKVKRIGTFQEKDRLISNEKYLWEEGKLILQYTKFDEIVNIEMPYNGSMIGN